MKDDIINIYCDESHPNQLDGQDFMVLGALICKKRNYKQIKSDIQAIRLKHGLDYNYEFKWQKVNKKRLDFYKELIIYLSSNDNLRLKINLALGKRLLTFPAQDYDYNKWYRLMYYYMFQNFINLHKNICDDKNFMLLIDKKDSNSQFDYEKIALALNKRFIRSKYKHRFSAKACESREFVLIQCVDIIIGAVSYYHKRNYVNKYKTELMKLISERFKFDYEKPTPMGSDKVSFYIWKPKVKVY